MDIGKNGCLDTATLQVVRYRATSTTEVLFMRLDARLVLACRFARRTRHMVEDLIDALDAPRRLDRLEQQVIDERFAPPIRAADRAILARRR